VRYRTCSDFKFEKSAVRMRLALTYSGPLPPNGGNADKHAIRKALLPQLRRQWEIEPALIEMKKSDKNGTPKIDNLTAQFTKGKFKFAPLVTRDRDLVCYLELTLLRLESSGKLLRVGGDIDNRLKTLFDSLSVPAHANQLVGLNPKANEAPFYCLLEDDSLVTGFEVKTERLLETPTNPNDVRLMITATVKPTKVTTASMGFLGG
jgi:hypothetical protein